MLKRFFRITFAQAAQNMNEEVIIANLSWDKKQWGFTTKTCMRSTKSVGITEESLITIIHRSLLNQHFGLGNTIVKVANGIIEGQSTSTKLQNFYYQMLFNLEYGRLVKMDQHSEAQKLSLSSFIFVDDSFNYRGMLKGRDHMIHNMFNLEYEENDREIKSVGLKIYKCSTCDQLSVSMDREKHQGFFFPRSMLDEYRNSNSPMNSLRGHAINAAIRVYRQNSDPRIAITAFAELKLAMIGKGYPKSAQTKVKNKLGALTINEPKSGKPGYMEYFYRRVVTVINSKSTRELEKISRQEVDLRLCFECCDLNY